MLFQTILRKSRIKKSGVCTSSDCCTQSITVLFAEKMNDKMADSESSLVCRHCSESCQTVEEFMKHFKEKHLETLFECTKCSFDTSCQGTMSDHISRYHDNDASLVKRKLISKVSATPEDYQTSIHNHFIRIAKNPVTSNGNNSQLIDKLAAVVPKPEVSRHTLEQSKENELDCDMDRMDLNNPNLSDGSDLDDKAAESKFECKVCLQKFTRLERVNEHYDAIHLKMVYTCCICGYINRWKRSVIAHLIKKHNKDPPYKTLMAKKRVETADFTRQNSHSEQSFTGVTIHKDDARLDSNYIMERKEETSEQSRDIEMTPEQDSSSNDSNGKDDSEDAETNEEDSNGMVIDLDETDDLENGYAVGGSRKSVFRSKKSVKLRSLKKSTTRSNQDQSRNDSLLSCKICGFSHRWPLIVTNHLRIFHKLQPPLDQYIHKIGEEEKNKSKLSDELIPDVQNYNCKLCDIAFTSAKVLNEHNEDLHTDLVWSCKLCSYANKWQQLAISHLRIAHNTHPPYIDHLTRKSSGKTSALLKRLQATTENIGSHLYAPSTSAPIVKEEPVNVPKISADPVKNDTNIDVHKSSEDIPRPPSPYLSLEPKIASKDCYRKLYNDQFQCKTCNKICGSAQGITEHFEAFHLGWHYQCRVCGFTDIWRSMLTKHLQQKHSLKKPYEKYLKRVKLEPLDQRPDYVPPDSSISNNRRRSHLKAALEAPLPKSHPKSSSPATKTNPESYRQHRSTITNGRLIITTQVNKRKQTAEPHETRESSKINEAKLEDMAQQYEHVDNQLKCKICGSVFTSLQGFQEHYEAIHLDVIWTCLKCPTSFRWRQQLTKHLKLIHERDPPFNEFMVKEAGSHKLRKTIPEKIPHEAYSRRSTPQKRRSANDNSEEGDDDEVDEVKETTPVKQRVVARRRRGGGRRRAYRIRRNLPYAKGEELRKIKLEELRKSTEEQNENNGDDDDNDDNNDYDEDEGDGEENDQEEGDVAESKSTVVTKKTKTVRRS